MFNRALTCVEDDVIMTNTVAARFFLTGLCISTRVTSVWIGTVACDVSPVITKKQTKTLNYTILKS